MKKVIVGLAFLLLSIAPSLVAAQGLPGMPGLPSMGGLFGRSEGSCGEKSCDPGLGLALEVGYTADRNGVTFDFSNNRGFAGLDFNDWKVNYRLQGLWLGLSATVPVGQRLSFIANGSWLFPSNQRANEEEYFVPFTLTRRWSTSIQWSTVGAGAALNLDGPASLVAGFRWESLQTTFRDPELQNFQGGLPYDEADIKLNLYLPYVGLVMGLGSWLSSTCAPLDPRVQVGLIGFPYTPGEIKYGETIGSLEPRLKVSGPIDNGFFMEAFLNCNCGLPGGGGTIGFFAKWSYVHGKAGTTSSAEDFETGFGPSDSVDVNFDRRNWILGAIFDVNFVSPYFSF